MKHSGSAHSAPLRYSATVRGAEVEAILNAARITENVDAQICMMVQCYGCRFIEANS